ncbi:hypothetical protein UFOVP1383_39 [uncultured Caudovirales phage]|uniref:Uncharacterized protein n=1 Tax=uncultured Caudovirales phage TaxID=2100421 RepID=A0A6J5Q607_9CAUD|nr:hypothetical protein UFOVP848_2 [uncultured Caudovirales phage]CAB4172939.1 hypothetical protein UFOVP945_4 [uncultured Caudovirales phage]CAB4179659.1 hypothetical protein UFOVP1023_38 [uncultured Caudovirales phage]CAB4204201.1 hypothetical protein UFOVP1383_39 [uncultured Caudovirales phage]CAB4215833.1 hypothetical protein UFOVP1477_9 [uncultured Caudovirales phage]
MIATARTLYALQDAAAVRSWLLGLKSTRQAMSLLGIAESAIGGASDVDAVAPPAFAYVNHGRWVADCPMNGCGGALVVAPYMRGFLCGSCINVDAAHRFRPLSWPENGAEIEAALDVRPLETTRNWRPGETVEDLLAENERELGGDR